MAKPDNTLKRKQREEKEDAEDGLKFVIDGAKLKCDLCTVPEGDLKVNYDTPSTQDKRTATIVEKDKKSVIFKGNCKKSPQSASPCASVMKLADWKDVGTVYFQDKFPLLLKSTIKCEYGGVPIKITDSAQRNVIEKIDAIGAPVLSPILDFDIKFTLDKTEKTVVPFGILDFKDKIENPFFRFKYKLEKSNIDSLHFEIIDESGDQLYAYNYLKPVIIQNKSKEKLFKTNKVSNIPMTSAIKPIGSPDLEPNDYTVMGSYILSWDGFDNNEIYDSTRFNGKDLKAKITARKDGIVKSVVVDFSTKYSQVEWTDVKIDKKTKRIDVTLRVDLKDGGAKGLDCNTYTTPEETSYETFTPTTGKDPFAGIKVTQCDWDKIPASVINTSKPVIKTRTRSFQDLEKLAIDGLNYHWGRNKNHFIAKDIKVNDEFYELYMNSVNTKQKAMGSIELTYNTNGNWIRSGNPGSIKDPINAVGNIVSRQAICYNVGYIYYLDWYEFYKSKNWRYRFETDEDIDFKFTSAHETGHEILKKYGGTFYSYGHKGSVNSITQNMKDDAPEYPINKEIDIMPYYPSSPKISLFKNYAASEKDSLGLIWLTKIEIK